MNRSLEWFKDDSQPTTVAEPKSEPTMYRPKSDNSQAIKDAYFKGINDAFTEAHAKMYRDAQF